MNFEEIFAKACAAAEKAYLDAAPRPMGVVQNGKVVEIVDDGMCGFAWVNLPGRSKFVNFLKSKGLGDKGYPKGYEISSYEIISIDRGQSYERKRQGVRAFVQVLRENGIEATPVARLD